MDVSELGTRIARAREAAGRSQGSLAEAVGVDRSAISRIEQGGRKVAVAELLRLAEALGRPLAYFVSDPVPAVVSRRRDGEHTHETNGLLDVELDSFAMDLTDLLRAGVVHGADRGAHTIDVPKDHASAERIADGTRTRLSLGNDPIDDLGRVCEDLGLVVYAARLGPEGPNGACVEVGEPGNQLGVAVINGDAPPGRRRMTLAHELGHWVTGDAYDREATGGTEQMLNSIAIHLLAPRGGVARVWRQWADRSIRDRALGVSAHFRVSWSAAVSQLANLSLISRDERDLLVRTLPTSGEFARLGLDAKVELMAELRAPYLPPTFVSCVLTAYTREELTSERVLELLRGTLEREDLPPVNELAMEDLRSAFVSR